MKIGLKPLQELYRPYWGGIFLVSTALFLTEIVASTYHQLVKKIQTLIEKRKSKRNIAETERKRRELLTQLTGQERDILQGFITNKTKTQRLDVNSGIVTGLLRKNMIYLASSTATSGPFDSTIHGRIYSSDFNLEDWVWEYISSNPMALSLNDAKAVVET